MANPQQRHNCKILLFLIFLQPTATVKRTTAARLLIQSIHQTNSFIGSEKLWHQRRICNYVGNQKKYYLSLITISHQKNLFKCIYILANLTHRSKVPLQCPHSLVHHKGVTITNATSVYSMHVLPNKGLCIVL